MSRLSLPQGLQMPLRDALRGLGSLAEATEDLLPLRIPGRGALRDALHALEGRGAAMLGPHVGRDEISRASAFLRGEVHGAADAARCANVLAFAWDRMRLGSDLRPLLSETLAAARLAGLRGAGDLTPDRHAAEVLVALRRAHVTGPLPGLPGELSPDDRASIDLHLVSLAVWLLSERTATLDEEMRLLDLALALTRACRDDVLAAAAAPQTLAPVLQSLSQHL